jgi:pimeloyl-ACP methyl ester carboxylesterase
MLRRTFVAFSLAIGGSWTTRRVVFARQDADTATPTVEGKAMTHATPQSGYATVNGLDLYYESHGRGGVPLVLLHGGFMTIPTWGSLVPELARTRQVIAVELEGHGRTPILDRPLSYEQMADDVAALLAQLGVSQADVFGYSLGGGAALQTAFRHPEVVRKLVIASAPYQHDGWAPEILAAMGSITPEGMTQSPFYEPYLAVAPKPDDWPAFVAKVRHLLTEVPYDWADDVAALDKPVLLIYGDADSVRPEHIQAFFRLLGGDVVGDLKPLPDAQLAILPGTAHSAVALFDPNDLVVPIITRFLDAPMPEAG